jgi:Zn-dependent peptidase ImmA (M78 family)
MGYNERVFTDDDFDLICEQCGIYVTEQKIKWHGYFTVCEGTPAIVINKRLRGVDRLVVAFHEVGHYLLHAPGTAFFCNGSVSKSEYEAQRFAAWALIPRPLMEDKTLSEIQEEFGYPTALMRFRQRIFDQSGI